jgi:hypothetical protein
MELGLKVKAEKTKHTLVFHHHNAGQNHDIKIENRSFDNGAQFYYNINRNRHKTDANIIY